MGAVRGQVDPRRERQLHDRRAHEREIHGALCRRRQTCRQPVRREIPDEERRLEEHQTRRPYGCGAAEQGQDAFRRDRLDQEEQRTAQEDRGRESRDARVTHTRGGRWSNAGERVNGSVELVRKDVGIGQCEWHRRPDLHDVVIRAVGAEQDSSLAHPIRDE